ncbi:YdbC family protein [Neofamilia massiliensis]|uniref:YdbC family protein n=1 Tax=Neofamilia massiliensis TaxID=1673724 RepID=UPI0006BB8798|nr:PC4/YdbC family ssDNA-binding protein [Neofamilia massiliensis]
MAEFKFEIVEKIGVLGEKENGWTKELNLVSYNDYPAKYDIREWDPDHQKMSKGITLSKEELLQLKELLKDIK